MNLLRRSLLLLLPLVMTLCFAAPAQAFCGFYVARADTKLYNQASQVAIARSGDRTILTMANDYQGEVKDFALVVPVPVVLKENQVQVADPQTLARLDAFSAPRLVEYFDPDPCGFVFGGGTGLSVPDARAFPGRRDFGGSRDRSLGITVEAKFTVGEYDILILSAKESNGLQTWLSENGYRIPEGGEKLLQPYIRQKMKFFVAKVNLKEFEQAGFKSLRPLQIAYEASRFMLPIRLGMINAQAEQDLIVYLLSPKGQVELTNYRTVKIPSNQNIPVYVKNEFSDFYKAMFQTAYRREDKRVAFLEYAWDMQWCDPCSADPLSQDELRKAGVFWLTDKPDPRFSPVARFTQPQASVFMTRLHVRYTRDKFPEDLTFQETANREFFQGRYILRHPFVEDAPCPQGEQYQKVLNQRFEQEAKTLRTLTEWNPQEIRRKTKQTLEKAIAATKVNPVQPSDSAYQFLKSFYERFGPVPAAKPSPFADNQPLKRYQFAKALNALMFHINSLVATNKASSLTPVDLQVLGKLQQQFAPELRRVRLY